MGKHTTSIIVESFLLLSCRDKEILSLIYPQFMAYKMTSVEKDHSTSFI